VFKVGFFLLQLVQYISEVVDCAPDANDVTACGSAAAATASLTSGCGLVRDLACQPVDGLCNMLCERLQR
jgi:hypothetical protein